MHMQSAIHTDTGEKDLLAIAKQDHHTVAHPRMAWMLYYQQTKSVRKVCQRFGISRKTFYKWWARYKESGFNPESLKDVSRKPLRSPNATPVEVVERVIFAKKKTGFGQRKLKAFLEEHYNILLSEHTIWKLLKQSHSDGAFASTPSNRANGSGPYPGDIVEISFMDITPYVNHKPWVQYTAIDVGTKLRISRIYERHSSASATDFLKFVIEQFPFAMKEVRTPDDKAFTNGSPTMGISTVLFEPFRVILSRNGIKHMICKAEDGPCDTVRHAGEIDRVEFFELGRGKPAEDLQEEAKQFVVHWNNHRRQDDMNGLTPLQKLRTFSEFKHVTYFDPFEHS
jgi:transposase